MDCTLLDVNSAFEKMLVLNRDQIIGASAADVYKGINGVAFDWYGIYEELISSSQGKVVHFEQFFDAAERWYEITSYLDAPGYFVSIFRDVSEFKKELNDTPSVRNYDKLFIEDLPVFGVMINENGIVKMMNKAMLQALGYNSEEVVGVNYIDKFVPYAEQKELEEVFKNIVELNVSSCNENSIITKNGELLLVEWHGRPILNSDGSFDCFLGLGIDVSKRKQVEEEFKKSERKYREILDTMEEGYYEVDLAGNFTFFNDSLCSIMGCSPKELKGLNYKAIYRNPEDVFAVYNRVYRTGHSEKAVGWPIITGDGRESFLEVSIVLQRDNEGNPVGFRGVARDMTERKRAEEALLESEEKFRALAESSPVAIMTLQNDYWVYVNRAAEEITGYPKEELYEMPFWEIVHPDFRSQVKERGQQRQQGEHVDPFYEFKIVTKQGEERWVSLTGATSTYQGVPAGFVTLMDITERKEAEEALKKSEKKYREILYTMEEGFYETDLSGNITFCNHSAARLLGYDLEELWGKNFRDICRNPEEVYEYFNRIFKTGKPEYSLTLEMQRKDDSVGYGEFSVTPIKNEEGIISGFRGIVRDITKRLEYEERLKYLSFHDQLTGLYNRAYFENEIERLSKSREYPITIVSVDLDGLKLVNDTLGHAEGDKLLKLCADVLREIFRSSDIISRVGGDEFAIILPRTDKETGQKIVNRIYKTLDNYNKELQKLPLHVSLGLATAYDHSKSLEETFKEADDLMYQDKSFKSSAARQQMIQSLVYMLGEKDFVSIGHIHQMEKLSTKLGEELNLSGEQISLLSLLAQMHDIGKVSIPDEILFKEEPLTPDEWEIIQQHTEKGYRIALSSMDLPDVAELILKHHERWDGKGYPYGIKAEEIPLEARILAVVDAYDAMTNDRPYRKAMTKVEAIDELQRCAGSQFDPHIVEAFVKLLEKDYSVEK